jgi:glutamate racemase
LLVPLAEEGWIDDEIATLTARKYLAQLFAADPQIDTLVLGCTHYPLLAGVISYVMGPDVTLVSSAEETAKELYRVLADADLLRPDDRPAPEHGFTTTGDPEEFRRLALRFLGLGPNFGHLFTSTIGVPAVSA